MGYHSTFRSRCRGGETISDEKIEAEKNGGTLQVLPETLREFFENRYASIKAFMVIILLAFFSALFSFPMRVWYLSVIGWLLCSSGVLIERKLPIDLGIGVMAAGFYISNLALSFSSANVVLLISAFLLFYGGLMYINNLVKLNKVISGLGERSNNVLDNYRKKWNRSLAKKLSLAFMISIVAFFIAWAGSFNLGTDTDMMLLFALSLLFAAVAISLMYLLIVKLPEFYHKYR